MRRKAASVFLCLVMLLQLAPVFTIGAAAAGAVTYNPSKLPAAIFNAGNANNKDYYESYATGSGQYNAISQFTRNNSSKTPLSYSTSVNYDAQYNWSFDLSNPNDTVGQIWWGGGLYANASGLFKDDWHSHASGWHNIFTTKVLSYTQMRLDVGNNIAQSCSGLSFSSSTDVEQRLGNGKWSALGTNTSLSLIFHEPDINYNSDGGQSTCSCHTGSVYNLVAALYDAIGPSVAQVTADSYKTSPGRTVNVTVTFKEPIRFADNSANHGDATINLRLDSHDASQYVTANLTKLEGNSLTFSCTIPETTDADVTGGKAATAFTGHEYTVSSVDLSPLLAASGSTYPLAQVGNGGQTFAISDSFTGDGYTTTTALITDLAGNPMSAVSANLASTLRIDGVAPTVASITQQAVTNNANVKAALGKTKLDPSDKDYIDYSDTHLGAGDSVTFTANFSELINIDTAVMPAGTVIKATTNLTKSDGNAATVTYQKFQQVAATATAPAYSALIFMPLTIESGMKCSDAGGKIGITKIEFLDASGKAISAQDICGNNFDAAADLTAKNTNAELLDVTGPAVTTASSQDAATGKYTPTQETDGFYFPFTVAGDSNELALLTGSFVLEPSDGAGGGTAFQYAVTQYSTDTPSWKDGAVGTACTFEQFEGQRVLHIRTVAGVTYDLADPNLVFKPEDYAGNIGSTTFQLNWKKDGVAPTASAGAPSRALTNASARTGTLTVPVTAVDHSGFQAIQYAWGGETAPASWTDSGATFSAATATVSFNAIQTVTGTNFSQHLWVKATDSAGNILTQDLGVFGYDLSSAVYTLTPSSDYANAALAVSGLGSDDALAFLVHVPGDTNANNYFVRYVTSDTADIFDNRSNWSYKTVSVTGGVYSFTTGVLDTTVIEPEFYKIIAQGEYYGELTVTTLSGKKAAFTTTDNGTVVLTTAGNNTNPVAAADTRLRVASLATAGSSIYSASFTTTLTPDKALTRGGYTNQYSGFDPTNPNTYMYSTLTGAQFTLTIANTQVAAWGLDELDFSSNTDGTPKSYLAIVGGQDSVTTDPDTKAVIKVPLVPVKADANGKYILTVTIPNGDIPSECYHACVVLTRRNGKKQVIWYTTDGTTSYRFYVDASGAGATALTGVAVNNSSLSDYAPADLTLYAAAPETEGAASAAVLRFPASNDYYSTGHYLSRLIFNVAAPDSAEPAKCSYAPLYYGQRAIRVWNTTAGQTESSAAWRILVSRNSISSTDGTTIWLNASYMVQLVADAAAALAVSDKTILPMFGGQNNVIAVQTMCDNGKLSDVRYYTLFPVTAQVQGTFSTTRDGESNDICDSGELVFTPAASQSMTGVKLYSCTGSSSKKTLVRTEMTEQLDGTYRCPLNKGLNNYYDVCAVDADNNYTLFDSAPTSPTGLGKVCYFLDAGAPVITQGTTTDNGDGTYTATYTVTDDSNLDTRPLTLHLGFDDAYLTRLGQPSGSEFTLTLAKGESWSLASNTFNPFGIYSVSVASSGASQTETIVTIKGMAKYNAAAAASCTLTPSLSVTDVFGNASAAVSNPPLTLDSVKPAITGATFANSGNATYKSDMALTVTFNQPVTIAKSWICQSPSGYSASKKDEIPVTNDGTHTVSFSDVFGTLWQEDYDFTCFGAYGIDVTLSTTELTTDTVTVGVSVSAQYEDPVVQYFYGSNSTNAARSQSQDGYRTNQIWRYASLSDYNSSGRRPESSNPNSGNVDITMVYVTNQVSGAPDATVYYRFEDVGAVYTGTLPASTTGKVTAWYTTDRNVTPTDDTGTTHVFDAAGTYTFTYQDDFGHTGSVTADLSGVTFGTGYVTPPDTTAPQLSVSIEGKRGGSYAAQDNFGVSGTTVNGSTTIASALTKAGRMQSYNFAVTATDASACKLVVLSSMPSTMDYASAVSDTITGVTVSGRNVYAENTVTADFTVAVVDSAGNFSAFTIPHASLLFDNTAPTLTAEKVYLSLYDVYVFMKLEDKDNSGTTLSDGATVTAPDLQKWTSAQAAALTAKDTSAHVGEYYYEFKYNGSITVYAADAAGNTVSQTFTVSGIDSSSPKLTAVWSPCLMFGGTAVPVAPTSGPVKTDVTALVTSDKPIASYTVKYKVFDATNLWPTDYSDSFTGAAADKPVISVSDTDKTQLTVTFPASGIDLELTVTAINGKTAVIVLELGVGVIDKTPFTAAGAQTDVLRTGYTVPYAKTIALTPTKLCYSTDGSGGTYANGDPLVYGSGNPLTVTVYSNGTYRYRFTDQAGNIATATVNVTGIDNTAPTITIPDTSGLAITGGNATVKVTLSEPGTVAQGGSTYTADSNNTCTLTFSQNGSYPIAAYDLAGNVSYGRISIGNIDHDAPTIMFDTPTVKLVQGSPDTALTALLNAGYTASDGANALPANAVTYDSTGVVLGTPGLYGVVYTVTDAAGNDTTATRWVQVYSKDLPLVIVDGIRADLDGLVMLKDAASHTLTVGNLKTLTNGQQEPYKVYLRRGIWSTGQMKGALNTLTPGTGGAFALPSAGYYTLYIVTQSRQTFRALLYVEK